MTPDGEIKGHIWLDVLYNWTRTRIREFGEAGASSEPWFVIGKKDLKTNTLLLVKDPP